MEMCGLGVVSEDVVEGVGVLAFLVGFSGDESFGAMFSDATSVDGGVLLAGAGAFGGGCVDSCEAGFFEDGVDASHLGEGFDPGPGAELAAAADEVGGDAGSAEGGMKDDAGEHHDLLVEGAEQGA